MKNSTADTAMIVGSLNGYLKSSSLYFSNNLLIKQ